MDCEFTESIDDDLATAFFSVSAAAVNIDCCKKNRRLKGIARRRICVMRASGKDSEPHKFISRACTQIDADPKTQRHEGTKTAFMFDLLIFVPLCLGG